MVKLCRWRTWTARTCKRPFVTFTLFAVGYIFVALVTLLPLMIFLEGPSALKALYTMQFIPVAAFYAYLTAVWNLAPVISVNYYGIEALGKQQILSRAWSSMDFLKYCHCNMAPDFTITSKHFTAVQMMNWWWWDCLYWIVYGWLGCLGWWHIQFCITNKKNRSEDNKCAIFWVKIFYESWSIIQESMLCFL